MVILSGKKRTLLLGDILRGENLDFKDKGGVGRYLAYSSFSIAQRRRDNQFALAADFHALDAQVPALDNLSRTKHELERLTAVI